MRPAANRSALVLMIALVLLALLLFYRIGLAQTLPHNIPNFCVGSPDTVTAGQTLTLAGTVSKGCIRVESGGRLVLTSGLTLTVDLIFGLPGASLEGGTAATPLQHVSIIGRDGPFDAGDLEQFGRGWLWLGTVRLHGAPKTAFVRLAAEPLKGQTTLTLAAAVTGWLPGDRLVIPGTRQPTVVSVPTQLPAEWETPILANVSGLTLTLAAPLAFDHRGARDVAGVLQRLPHVGNLTRSIVIRSQNPAGTRAHVQFVDRADVDIRYVAFLDLGRTTTQPIKSFDPNTMQPGTNQIGRYPLHLHHVFGPLTPSAYQFALVGDVIEGSPKSGITIHNSSYGLVQDNLTYNVDGAGIVTEDGAETGNLIDHNFIVRTGGTGAERADDRPIDESFHDGTCLFLRGPNNRVRNNVLANCLTFGLSYMVLPNGGVGGVLARPLPAGPGQVPTGSTNLSTLPILENTGTEIYGSSFGLTIWDVMAKCCIEVYEGPVSSFQDLTIWHTRTNYYYSYGHNRVTFDHPMFYGDAGVLADGTSRTTGFYFGDYISRNTIIQNGEVHNLRAGLQGPIKAGDVRDIYGQAPGTLLIEGGTWRNVDNVVMTTPYGVTGGGPSIAPRRTTLRNVTLGAPTAPTSQTHYDVRMIFQPEMTNVNVLVADEVWLEAGEASSRVYYREQAPTFVIPDTPVSHAVAGLTNAQAFAKDGSAIAGSVAPCATTPAATNGFLCPATGTPPPVDPDSDGDGVKDSLDKCPATHAGTPVDTTGCAPPPQGSMVALEDYSALPVCTTVGPTATFGGHAWTLEPAPSFKLLQDGAWSNGRGFVYIRTATALYAVGTNGRIYQRIGDGWQSVTIPDMGCRLPTSASGATVLQQNGYLVDSMGGTWIATCAYTIFATFCPDFAGSTIEAGIILRNATRFPPPGIRSIAEPANGPWNLKWCGGEMYVHTYPTPGTFGRWQGLANPMVLAPANVNDCGNITPPPQGVTITLNAAVRGQTITGWEASSVGDTSAILPIPDAATQAALDLAVSDVGITRMRVALRSGWEGPGDRYDIVNDNSDPNVINPAGFHWARLDEQVNKQLIPFRNSVQKAGLPFQFGVAYVDFDPSPFEHAKNPAEYAEYMLAVWQHLKTVFNLTPTWIDVILEPGNGNPEWTPTAIGQVIAATGQRFQKEGLTVPEFMAPSTVVINEAPGFIDQVMAVPGAGPFVTYFSYHRYGGSPADVQQVAQRAVTHNKKVIMTERVDPGLLDSLHDDLTIGRNSSWMPSSILDTSLCAYNQVVQASGGVASVCPEYRLLRQYYKYIRPGAQRIDSTSSNAAVKPVAFINTDGKYVVVVLAKVSGPFSISGLPAGQYGVSWTDENSRVTTIGADVTVTAGQPLSVTMPTTGPITIAAKTAGPPPPLDSDGDGVTDTNDKCPGTPAGTPVDASGCAIVVPPQPGGNVAAAANGGVGSASSSHASGSYAPAGAINGDRLGAPWGQNAGWNDDTPNVWPDWLQIDFSGPKTIDRVSVFSLQDAYTSPSPPTTAMTCSLYCLQDFQVQSWTGSAWVTLATVTGNKLVWRDVSFPAVTTSRIRLYVTAAGTTWSRVAELEAYTTGVTPPPVLPAPAVAAAPSLCTFTVAPGAPPDTAGGWASEAQRRSSVTTPWITHSDSDQLSAATSWEFRVQWTKTGQATQVTAATAKGCAAMRTP